MPLHQTWQMNLLWQMDPLLGESRIDALNTTTPNLADEPTLAKEPPNASWDIYYGMYLAAILDSSRKGGNFFVFLNN